MGARANRLFYNLIMVLPLIVMLLLSMLGLGTLEALALEQEARCGYEEHAHTEDCYIGEILVCGQKAHSHSQNCYLVLLEDNDINWLLQTMSGTEEKSLEGIIDSALVQALSLNENLHTDTDEVPLNEESISTLNATIQENDIQPSVVLNENLKGAATLAAPGSGSSSTWDVGGSPTTGTRYINFYAQIDGTITLIGSGQLQDGNPDTYSRTNIVSVYTSELITSLSTGNINSTFYFYFNTDGDLNQASSFDREASYPTNSVGFENNSNTRYALLSYEREQSWFWYTYNPVPFYSVTFRNNHSTSDSTVHTTQYVQSDLSARTPSVPTRAGYRFTGWYTDAACTNAYNFSSTVTAKTTLYAGWEKSEITVTWKGASTTTETKEPNSEGTVAFTVPEPPSGYIWVEEETLNRAEGTVTVSKDTTFIAVPAQVKLTYLDENGTVIGTPETYPFGTAVTVPMPNAGYVWMDSDERIYTGGEALTLTADKTLKAANVFRVTYVYRNGTTESVTVAPGGTVTLPTLSNTVWVDEDGNQYSGGATSAAITKNITIYERGTLTIRYTVGLSTSNPLNATPTVIGGTTQVVGEGASVTIRTVTPDNVYQTNAGKYSSFGNYHFEGWARSSGSSAAVALEGNTVLTWEELSQYGDVGDTINLTGKWTTSGNTQKASFYIRLDSRAADIQGDVDDRDGDYTGMLYSAFVGNPISTTQSIVDETPDNSRTADETIRSLVGKRSDGMWISGVPRDEDVLEALKTYANNNQLYFYDENNQKEYVKANELTTDNYAVRWYTFKYVANPTNWHVDGRLVRKEGTIRITKTFVGDELLVAQGKQRFEGPSGQGFYIEASYDDTSSFNDDRLIYLTLDGSMPDHVTSNIAVALAPVSQNGSTYEWQITQALSNQLWTIKESLYEEGNKPDEVSIYTEYTVYNSKDVAPPIAEYGTQVTVSAVTQAVDESEQHMLKADFINYYLSSDSVAVKKEDGATGRGIPGVTFELFHQGEQALLKFVEQGPGHYKLDNDNGSPYMVTDANGYILIDGFSYDKNPVIVREVIPSPGYGIAPDITLQEKSDSEEVIITQVGGEAVSDPEDVKAVAEYYDREKVLVIKNYVSEKTSVTVQKKWLVEEALRPDTVTVELYANGQLVSNVIPGFSPVSVVLKKDADYKYTWSELPLYVDGSTIQWSVVETAVGDEKRTVNGNFLNWMDIYDVPKETYVDGSLVNTYLAVYNSTYHTSLFLQKTDETGAKALPGIQFRLQGLTNTGQLMEGGFDKTLTTDDRGWLQYDNLAEGYYRLTEVKAPAGYTPMTEPVDLHIAITGEVSYASYSGGKWTLTPLSGDITSQGAFTIRVVNHSIEPLPETGGTGTYMYTQSGLLLMLLSVALYLYRTKRRREVEPS